MHQCTTYQHPDGRNYILVIYNGLHIPSQEPSLVCPKQLRLNGVALYDFPRNLCTDGKSLHSINDAINDLELINLPLNLDSVISHFPYREL